MEEQSDSKGSTILIAMDESDHSFYALEWALNTLISHEDGNEENKNKKKTKNVILAHARLHPTASAGLGGAGFLLGSDVIVSLERAQFREIDEFMNKALEICNKKKVSAEKLVVAGDPRDAICELVENLNPSFLVIGSHGYGAIKRAVLGSVSDYCAHHAKCPVIIVKKPH